MKSNRCRTWLGLSSGIAFLLLNGALFAQAPSTTSDMARDFRGVRPTERIHGAINNSVRVVRAGNRHPSARSEFDAGPAAPDTRMDRMILLLTPDAAQQQALDDLVAAQQDPESPLYHQWLTPESFGEQFGIAEGDLQRVVGWLLEQGFEVEPISQSRREVIFSGTAAQVEAAFSTQIRTYVVDGESHYANADDPEIPEALAEVVGGVVTLHDFHAKPQHRVLRPASGAAPMYTSGTAHYLAPADFATIYNVASVYGRGIDGSGQTIAVAGRTNVNPADAPAFRNRFGLPPNDPTVVLNGTDPGIVSTDEEVEAALDVQWAGAVAKNAAVQLVVSGSTRTTDGIKLSAQYIVNHNQASVASVSFGACEAALGTSENRFWNGLWQQAAALGITVVVSSGDSGAAGCDDSSAAAAASGAGVNGLCSTPYSTCVGGTQFADTNGAAYWSASNAAGTLSSALSYIPEAAWNSSGAAGGSGLWAGGGGYSTVYPKPAWQPSTTTGGWRGVPDVSLNASTHDGYLISVEGKYYIAGGTSAAAPSFAGMMSLVAQSARARQGNANPALYALATRQAAGGAAAYHDITTGSNSVPGQSGFSAGPGWDAATGLGSVNANVMVTNWSAGTTPIPSLQLAASPSPAAVTQGSTVPVTVTAAVSGGFNSVVVLSTGTLPSGMTASFSPASLAAPGAGSSTLRVGAAANMAAGSYNLSVVASGGGLSQTISLPVTVCSYSISPTAAPASAAGGSYQATVTTQAGCAWSAAASSASPWISVTSGSPGSGSGKVTYLVAANNSTAPRTGTLAIAGVALTVTQAAATATYSLSPGSVSVAASGGSGTVGVTVNPAGTSWTAVSTAAWITVTSGASGSGSRSVGYLVAANTTSAARTGSIAIGSVAFTITQSGGSCTYNVSVGPVRQTAAGFTGTILVYTGTGCPWTASSNASWLTFTSAATGTGNATVGFMAAPNTTRSSRVGVMTVAGYTITVTEAASTASPNVKLAALPASD